MSLRATWVRVQALLHDPSSPLLNMLQQENTRAVHQQALDETEAMMRPKGG